MYKRFLDFNRIKEFRVFRYKIIIAFVTDVIIFGVFAFSFKQGNEIDNILIKNFLILSLPIWVFISYLNNRYHNFFKILTIKNLIKIVSRISFNFIILNLIAILLINLSYFEFNLIIYIKKLITISIMSIIFEIFINLILKKSSHDKKYLFIGESKKYELLSSESNKREIIDYLDYKDINKIKNLVNKYEILIIDNLHKLNDEEIKSLIEFKQKGLLIMDVYQWCEKILKRFPSFLFKEEILTKKFKVNQNYIRLKRFGDVSLSLFILIASFPVVLIFAFMIFLEDGFPLIYKQVRVGHNGKEFKVYKLRSMKKDSEKAGAQWSKRNDRRVTKVGNFLRLSKIDELPQLFCVLRGEMSLIGPRPERPEFELLLNKEIPFYKLRHLIKPGLSGWAQVNYPYGSSINDSSNKLSYDLYYLNHRSLFMDFLIIFKTIKVIINSENFLPINVDKYNI